MKSQKSGAVFAALFAAILLGFQPAAADTTFNFQGRFDFEAAPAEGLFEFEITLFSTEVEGTPVAPALHFESVPVTGGLFSLPLNFGEVFDGQPRYLRIRLRPSGNEAAPWINLSPRQRLHPVPLAGYAATAGALAEASPSFTGSVTATSFLGDGSQLTGIRLHSLGSPDGAGGDVLVTDNQGRVGIGVAAPDARLDVDGSVRATAFLGDGSSLTGIRLHTLSSPDGLLPAVVVVDDQGNTGIGAAEPAGRLHVSHPGVAGQPWPVMLQNTEQNAFRTGMRVSDGGFFEISNNILAATPAFARLSSAGTWTAVSDRRMKRDIAPLTGALPKALALEPVTFHSISTPENSAAEKQIGLIAQQVREVLPELVAGDDTLSVDYTTLSVIAIAALREQQTHIEALEKRIQEMDSRLRTP